LEQCAGEEQLPVTNLVANKIRHQRAEAQQSWTCLHRQSNERMDLLPIELERVSIYLTDDRLTSAQDVSARR
jgi:hypothetical protein